VVVIYVLFNFAMLHALPVAKLAGSKLAAADAAEAIFGGYSRPAVTAIALISLIGIINASFLFTPRVMFALSRDGLFASSGTRVNAGGTPTVALVVTAAVAVVLAAVGTFDKLFALTAFLSVLVDVAAFGTLFVLRRKEPALARPFRARGYPVIPGIVLVGAIVLLIAFVLSSGQNAFFAAVGLAVSYPAYLVTRKLVQSR